MKLFEFESPESLEEGVAYFKNIRGIGVIVNDHAIDQSSKRGVPDEVFTELLKKIYYVKNKFKPFEENQKFTIWSNSLNSGIGLRRRSDKEGFMRVEVMTTINRLFDNPDPVFMVG